MWNGGGPPGPPPFPGCTRRGLVGARGQASFAVHNGEVVTDRIDIELVESSSSSLMDLVGLIGDYRAHFGFPRDPDGVLVWLRDRLGTTQLTAYLAWVSGHYRARAEAAAMAVVVRSPGSLSVSDYWNVRDLFVAPEHRRHGVARALLDEIIRRATTAGAPRLAVQTGEENEAAVRLYQGFGFRPVTGVRQLLLDLPTPTSETVRARHPL
jgi:GNAT superfamily N-acetyltransferase